MEISNDLTLERTLHFYRHSAKPNPFDDVPGSFSTAYGRGIYGKISVALKDRGDDGVTEKALRALVDLWSNPINVVESFTYSLCDHLAAILSSPEQVRHRLLASRALTRFIRNRSCRQWFYRNSALVNLVLDLMSDPEEQIKADGFRILDEIFVDGAGIAAVLEERLISRLVARAQDEDNPAIVALVLTCLGHVVADKMGVATLVELDPSLRNIIAHVRADEGAVRAAAALCLAQISRDVEGRKFVLQANGVLKLNKLLGDVDDKVRLGAARALMHLATDIRGKADIVELGVIPTLLASLTNGDDGRSDTDNMNMFILQCLASVAENPRGRFRLHEEQTLQVLSDIAESRPKLKLYADRATKIILWTP